MPLAFFSKIFHIYGTYINGIYEVWEGCKSKFLSYVLSIWIYYFIEAGKLDPKNSICTHEIKYSRMNQVKFVVGSLGGQGLN